MSASVEMIVDLPADAAYLRLSDLPVAKTVAVTDDIMVDLDALDVVVGVEVLSLGADLPFAELTHRFHVRSDVVDLLRLVQPSVSGYLSLTQAPEGLTSSVLTTAS